MGNLRHPTRPSPVENTVMGTCCSRWSGGSLLASGLPGPQRLILARLTTRSMSAGAVTRAGKACEKRSLRIRSLMVLAAMTLKQPIFTSNFHFQGVFGCFDNPQRGNLETKNRLLLSFENMLKMQSLKQTFSLLFEPKRS